MEDTVAEPDDPVVALWRRGQVAWPELALAEPHFRAHVAAVAGAGVDAETLHAEDLYLACACARGDEEAIRLLEDRYLSQVVAAVRAIDAAAEVLDEVKQRMRASLLVADGDRPAKIGEYAGRGALRSWLGVTAARTTLMLLRSRRRAARGQNDDWSAALALPATGNPELELFKAQYTAEFSAAIRAACASLPDRERAVLRLHFVEGLGIDQIGSVYGVHRATAARWVGRARTLLHDDTRARLQAELALSPSELESLTALVRSQLEVSLSQLFPADAHDDAG
jgi:RNA polymerase sigma-70 factor, ECF subfamily